MRLSLCMIAKNAATDIRRPLESLQGQMDEMVVINTGSTDETVEIARSFGARVYSFEWREDFAAAKNFALDKAHGDWIVFLDTDEWFAGGTGSCLRQTVAKYSDADALLIKMYNIDLDRQETCVDAFYTARIFRRASYIRYRGAIHEQICHTDGRALQTRRVPENALFLYHCGYSSDRLQVKAARNLRILQAEIEKGADPARFYAYLAEAYAALGNETQALRYARRDIALGRQPVTYASRSYRVGIEALKALDAPAAELEVMLRQAVRDFPEVPDFRAEYALFCYQRQRYAEAQAKFEEALHLQTNYSDLEPSIFYQSVELAKQFLKRIEKEWKRESEDVKTVKLSACLIAKNEEKRLPAWLARMRRCADELLVVDTGSTDRSKQIAADAGAKVCDCPWKQDFAAARNFAMAQAMGEWLLFLDADEVLKESVTKETLYEAIGQARQAECDAVLCAVVNLDAAQGEREMSRMAQPRLLRRAAALRFERPVCEKLVAAQGSVRSLARGYIEILHTGFSSRLRQQKQRRNLAILQREIKEKGEEAWQYRCLSEMYLDLGQYDAAMRYVNMHLEAGLEAADDRIAYGTLVSAMTLARRPEEETQAVLTEALRRFPQAAELLAHCGESLWRQEAFAQAKAYFLQALQADAAKAAALALDRFPAMRDVVCERLGEVALMEGAPDAAAFFKRALGYHKYNAAALRYLLLLLLQESEEVTRAWLGKTYAPNRWDLGFVTRVLERTQIGALYAAYAERYAQADSSAQERATQYRRLAAGKFEEAQQKALETLPLALQQYMIACFFTPPEEALPAVALAAPFAAVLRRYRGAGAPLEPSAFSSYMALLPEVLRYEGSDMLRRYAELGLDFAGEALLQIGRKLFAADLYALAAPFYTRYAAQGGAMMPLLHFEAGVAQYAAGALKAAKACLEAARGCEDKRWEIEAYLTWIEEKWSDG